MVMLDSCHCHLATYRLPLEVTQNVKFTDTDPCKSPASFWSAQDAASFFLPVFILHLRDRDSR